MISADMTVAACVFEFCFSVPVSILYTYHLFMQLQVFGLNISLGHFQLMFYHTVFILLGVLMKL
jgi:hypothetical protein